jgi:hypothetical protein
MMREFAPCNRHLSIARIEDEDSKEGNVTTKVLLPDEYKASKDHGTYRVVGSAPDCLQEFRTDSLVVVEEHLVRSLRADKEYLIIPEGAVLMVSK